MGTFNVLTALYMGGNYLYGTADHVNGTRSSVP